MTAFAVSTAVTVLALIGLAIGLVVFFVVVWLLNSTLKPLREILVNVRSAQKAPMLEHGVKGTDQLARTHQLANSIPDLAVAYMQKLGLPVDTEKRAETFPERGPSPPPGGFR